MTATEKAPKVQKTYYSRSQGYVLQINPGEAVLNSRGVRDIHGDKIVEFSPLGDGFGILVTDDPETQECIEGKMAAGSTMLLTEEQYYQAATPHNIQVADLKIRLQERDRLLTEQNKLINDLRNGKVGSK